MVNLILLINFALGFTFMGLMIYLRILSIKIEKLRHPTYKWFGSPTISRHYAPIPYFFEENDNEEIKNKIKRRNLVVLFFWITFIALFVSGFAFNSWKGVK
jgi:hypothetical protein